MECEISEFYSCVDRVARKAHECCECSTSIIPGEKYVYACGKWGGEFSAYKQHLLCANACRFIRDEMNDGECIGFGELMEWKNDYFAYYEKKHERDKPIRKMLADIIRRKTGRTTFTVAEEATEIK